MKQVVRRGLKEIVVEEVPEPALRSHHVLVQPQFSLISSGTEAASLHTEGVLRTLAENPSHLRKVWDAMKSAGPARTAAEVQAKFSEYAVLGYAGAGIVVEKHDTVSEFELGERVAYGGEGTGHAECVLAPKTFVARVPESVSFRQGCFATLGSIALNAVRVAQIGLGDTVAVIGCGIVGQLICQLARRQGGVVVALDLRPERLALAQQLGAHHTVLSDSSARNAVAALTEGRGADCVILAAAAKSAAPCQQALEICRERGRIIVVGAVEMSFLWQEMYLKEIQLLMARAYGPGCYDPEYERGARDYPAAQVRWTAQRNMEEFLRLLGTAEVQVEPLISHEFSLEDAPRAYETITDPAAASLAVVLRYPQPQSPEARSQKLKRRVEVAHARVEDGDLGVALVGAGNLTRWVHAPNVKKQSGVKLQAICSANGVRGKSYAARFGAAYCTSEFEQVLQDPNVHVLILVSRNQEHAPQALAALRAGKHVFVEKPMALTEDECRALASSVGESGLHLTVGFNRRFAPPYLEMKQALARRSGPAVINCRVNSPGISGAYWMADPAIGGAILGEACHFVDLMYWLLDSEPVSVAAYTLPTGKQEPIGENNLAASFRFADGSVGNLTYCTVGSKTSGGERVEVFAPGVATVSQDFKQVTTFSAMARTRRTWFPEKGYQAQMRSFFACIREGRPQEVTVRDGARATIACLRMLEAARTLLPCAIDLDAALQPKER